jgi:hypothetical protein
MDKKYIYYNDTVIYDTNKPKRIKTNNINNCLSECTTPYCKGMNIYKANCNNKIYCDNDSRLQNFNCDIINNIDKTNIIKNENNTVSLIDKSNFTLDKTDPFNIKMIDDKCLNFDKNNIGNLQSSCINFKSDKNKIYTDVKQNPTSSIIEKKCISVNGNQISLVNCNDNDKEQSFIYEPIFNTIRPYNNTNLCLTNDNNVINLTDCINSKENINQKFNLSNIIPAKIDTFNNICNYNNTFNVNIILIISIILILSLLFYYFTKNNKK